ncbi:hypothetical protein BDV38DRAFT_238381 [Aspergillus pseudotamarii]|uniref:Uncharacterized protein n=1 Tax=Aspergillus pseudotamarii TaxID=132259 RepID=A0A5N6T3W2_ASPPS|nr:uncharacterized protein BDV38DRAFT_238381 [Aspergillus pseudotamarii]KAE8140987.1 hypothetical protein BDV38DRAFT_238381 [Aspergillus pseudotamarii]
MCGVQGDSMEGWIIGISVRYLQIGGGIHGSNDWRVGIKSYILVPELYGLGIVFLVRLVLGERLAGRAVGYESMSMIIDFNFIHSSKLFLLG